jgi:type IV pilus assembly protein PilB
LHELDIAKTSAEKKVETVPGKAVKAVRPKRKLGEILIDAGVIDENTLNRALEVQRGQNRRIGEVLVDLGEATHDDIASALASKLGLPLISADELDIPKDLARLLQSGKIETSLVLPVKVTGNKLLLAMVDPLDADILQEIRHMTGYHIDVAVISRTDFSQGVAKFFAGTGVWY